LYYDTLFFHFTCIYLLPTVNYTRERLNFMFMGPCILVYNDHINNQRDAAFYALYLMVKLHMFRSSLAHRQEFRKLCLQPGVVFNYLWFCLLFVTCCICARSCGSWIGVWWLSTKVDFYALYLMVKLYMFRASLAHRQEFRKLCLQPGVLNYPWFCLLFVTCCICARFCGS